YPSGASLASVECTTRNDFTFSAGINPSILPESFVSFSWESLQLSGSVVTGLQIAIAQTVPRYADKIIASARVRLISTANFDSVWRRGSGGVGDWRRHRPVDTFGITDNTGCTAPESGESAIQQCGRTVLLVPTTRGTSAGG